MKIAVLWTRESGYFTAMLRAAVARGHDVHLFSQGTSRAAPFSAKTTAFPGKVSRNEHPANVLAQLEEFGPDVIVVAGWHVPAYRTAAQIFRGRAMRILSMDNQWIGSFRQRAGQLAFATLWRDTYDGAIVPGVRQRAFAVRLGFDPDRIYEGTYCADVELYAGNSGDPQDYFLFAGRNSPEKNLATLLAAYGHYRADAERPWRLCLVGADNFATQGLQGVEVLGFQDPDQLAKVMGSAGAFVLPSIREPWGVVLHEAAAAGRFLIASTACGSADAFLLNGIHGITFNPSNQGALAQALRYASSLTPGDLLNRGSISRGTAQRFRTESWTLAVEAAYERNRRPARALAQ